MLDGKKSLLAGFLLLIGLLCVVAPASASVPTCDPNDPECDPYDPPPTQSTIVPNGSFGLNPGQVACFYPLSAANSAGIGGYIGFYGTLNKKPKLSVWWSRNTNPTNLIYSAKLNWDSSGYFQLVMQPGNGWAGYFPGVFQFCLKNPAINTQPIYFNAMVVTY